MMKRFMTFTGATYYATGGANDFLNSFDTAEEAIQAGRNNCDEDYPREENTFADDWWHVFDSEKSEIIDGRGFPQC